MPLIRSNLIAFLLISHMSLATVVCAEEQVIPENAPIPAAKISVPTAVENVVEAPQTLTNAQDVVLELLPDVVKPEKEAPRDIWQRVRNGYAMRDFNSPLVTKHERWYAGRSDYLARMTTRARRYMYYIVNEVERRGMPTEIALLPMIESAFNPVANSTSDASGIWQFIPSTGRNFGLEQNWWYDERRDIISATNSALDYLQKLHNMFGDWELALAAYNWGEGAVQRAIDKNRRNHLPTNYASLNLPDQTRNYLPKLFAIRNIVANPKKYGLKLQTIPNEPYFTAVATPRHIDVKLAAQLAEISEDEFLALNPGHNRPVVLKKKGDVLVLPVDKVSVFQENLENYEQPLVSWQIYQPKKGERLDRIAPKLGLSLEKLKSINGLAAKSEVSTGQTLLVPAGEDDKVEIFKPVNMHLASAHETEQKVKKETQRVVKHTVHKGNTFNSLAKQYHVSVKQLKQWNGNLKKLKPGQEIVVAKLGVENERFVNKVTSKTKKSSHKEVRVAKRIRGKNNIASSRSSKNKAAVRLKDVKRNTVGLAQNKTGV